MSAFDYASNRALAAVFALAVSAVSMAMAIVPAPRRLRRLTPHLITRKEIMFDLKTPASFSQLLLAGPLGGVFATPSSACPMD